MPEIHESGVDGLLTKRARQAAEAIVLTMACASPWAYGAVDPWAQLLLALGLVAFAVVGFVIGLKTRRGRFLLCLPSLALGGLCALAFIQAAPLSAGVLKQVAPSTHALLTSLASGVPVEVKGDPGRVVGLPLLTLSQNPGATLHNALQLVAAWVLFQTVLSIGGGYPALRRFGLATVINGSLLTVFSIAQSLTWNGKIYGIRPSPIKDGWLTGGPFVCHSHLAAYLNVALGFALAFLLFAGKRENRSGGEARQSPGPRGSRAWAVYVTGLLIAGVIASHSRNGFLTMVVCTVVTLVVFRQKTVKPGLGLITVLLVVPIFMVAVGTASPFQRIATIADANETGFGSRTPIWGAVLQAWKVYPIFGTGVGSFAYALIPYVKFRRQLFFSHAENEYLHYLAEGGVLGLALVLACLVGVAWLGWRARNAAANTQERALLIGALFAAMSLAIESLGDFALHIPGVAISGLVVAGHLCRLGLDSHATAKLSGPMAPSRVHIGSLLAGLAMIGLSLLVFSDAFFYARAEAEVANVGILTGSGIPLTYDRLMSAKELEKRQVALERALKTRPNWAEGHIWLGLTHLALYERATIVKLKNEPADPQENDEARAAESDPKTPKDEGATKTAEEDSSKTEVSVPQNEDDLADPLWLHGIVHTATEAELKRVGDLLKEDAVRFHLAPAARCFLEARRCCPVLSPPHAYLGGLDYLLKNGEPGQVYARRALRLSGSVSDMISIAGRVAIQCGDLDLGARCWQHLLENVGIGWQNIADASVAIFTFEEILEKVVPPGAKYPIMFSDRLFSTPDTKEGRDLFLREALERLPGDATLSPAEKLWWEGEARAGLGEEDQARTLMKTALALDPLKGDWWERYVFHLIQWGNAGEAREQGLLGRHYCPDHFGLRKITEIASIIRARGGVAPPTPIR